MVDETEAAVVRIIFDKYVHEGFGAQRIATYLNTLGYRARTGEMWHHATIRGIICNLTYTCAEDPHRIVKRVRYICYGKTRKQTECDGQTGYTAHILDGIIDKLVRQIFERCWRRKICILIKQATFGMKAILGVAHPFIFSCYSMPPTPP